MTTSISVGRPGVVTFIGVVLYIKATIALVIGIALVVEKNSSALLEATGRDGDYILGTAIGEFILALLLFLVAAAIMSGAKWARLATAIVIGLRIAVASWWMITHVGGPLQLNALMSVGIGIFVLWALYGNDKSEAYFEGHPQTTATTSQRLGEGTDTHTVGFPRPRPTQVRQYPPISAHMGG